MSCLAFQGHYELAVPKYARLAKHASGRHFISVNVADAIALMKVESRDGADIPADLNVDITPGDCDEDGRTCVLRNLKRIFRPCPALKTMTAELWSVIFNLQDITSSLYRKPFHISTVSLTERLETCALMLPRLVSIAAHERAMRTEYNQMFIDFKLGRLISDADGLHFPDLGDFANFDAAQLLSDMQEYMKELGGAYELAQVEESPQPHKKAKSAVTTPSDSP